MENGQTTLSALAALLDANGILARGPAGAGDVVVRGASCDSRCARAGDLFFCKGHAFRPEFLARAVEAGAVAYVCEQGAASALAGAAPGAASLVTSDMRLAMPLVSAEAWGHPDRALPQAGITGTKGKSTCAYMLRAIVEAACGAGSCGVIGSIETHDGVESFESVNTTPEAPDLWRHLANARDAGLAAMAMEVSSQALKYGRVLGLHLDVAAFLNISRDHISPAEHADFEDYFASKLRIFTQCDTAVVNLACDHVDRVLEAVEDARAHGHARRLVSFGVERPEADVWASDVSPVAGGVDFSLHDDRGERRLRLGMPGLFNVDNALAAIAMARPLLGLVDAASGLSPELFDAAVAQALGTLRVPGRMELLETADGQLSIIVDYAHNKLSFEALFSSVEKEFPGRPVIALFGAPGGKAFERRRELPKTAGPHARLMIFTEEDPAHEDPADICAELAANAPAGCAYEVIVDREAAVARAFEAARATGERAVVLLLAKGDETRQHRGDSFPAIRSDLALARAYVEASGD